MSSVLERLRAALAPDIVVERELASGGMGTVFLARDVLLDRPIAVKVLRPELATAVAAQRFLREGRAAAQLSHPNIVRVHRADAADGLLYFTMDLVAGETLATRLRTGKLSPQETAVVGRDLLDALAAAHAHGLIHRDVKPSNIFLSNSRALLGDFGVALAVESDATTLTGAGQRVGTVEYMAPEQLMNAPITVQTDVYAVGLVLFEACTGRRWDALADPDKADWSGVPRMLRGPLRKALQLAPDERWPDAATFAAALAPRGVPWRAAAGVAALLLAAAGIAWRISGGSAAGEAFVADLVVFPFEVAGPLDSALGRELATSTRWYFDRLPEITLAPAKAAGRAWAQNTLPPVQRLPELTATLRSRYGVWGRVRPRGTGLEVELTVVDARGVSLLQDVVESDPSKQVELGDRVGARILGAIAPGLRPTFPSGAAAAQVNPEAALEFLQGEDAFARDAWLPAERHYQRALALDSTFLLAAWRLANARRWMPLRPDPPFPAGFLELYRARGAALPEVDRRLIEAQFAPSGAPRFELYEAARRLGRGNAYTMLLYGDELFHRGPLAGRPLSEAADMLAAAAAADPTLAPAWEHLAWALIRLGRRDEARRALDSLDRVAGRREDSEIYLPDFLHVALAARFTPAALEQGAGAALETPAALTLAARGALAFDLPEFELRFGRALAALDGAEPRRRAGGHVAQGLALVALGRPAAGLAQLDSAAALFPDPAEARLQSAEWRVIPHALGVPGFSDAEADRGRAALSRLATGHEPVTRAAWALAFDALARGDTAAAAPWRGAVEGSEPTGGPLAALLKAMADAAPGDTGALARSAAGLGYDSAGSAPDPFYRAALHLLRGDWYLASGRARDADRSWLWYENTDVVGWPAAEAQAGEVDWALSSHARRRRATRAFAEGRRDDGCALAARLFEIWSAPEPETAAAAAPLRQAAAGCPT